MIVAIYTNNISSSSMLIISRIQEDNKNVFSNIQLSLWWHDSYLYVIFIEVSRFIENTIHNIHILRSSQTILLSSKKSLTIRYCTELSKSTSLANSMQISKIVWRLKEKAISYMWKISWYISMGQIRIIKSNFRKLEQHPTFAKQCTFLKKNAPKILHQNKALHNFHKRGLHLIVRHMKGLN